MRVDNYANSSTMEQVKAQDSGNRTDKKTKGASSGSGDGVTIKGSELNLGEDLIGEKKKKARDMALKLIMDVYNKEARLDKEEAERSEHAGKLVKENEEHRDKISDVKKEKEITNELYDVNEESEEYKELELLRKGRDAGKNPNVKMTDKEWEQYKDIKARGVSEYQERMLELDKVQEEFENKIEDNNRAIIEDYAIVRGMKQERLKQHDMYDAVKQGEKIMEAASKEIVGMLIDDVKDNVDDEIEKKVEEGKEKKEKEEEIKERIERIRGEKDDKDEDDHEEMYELDSIMDEVKKMVSGKVTPEVKKSLGLIISELQLTAEDVKGIAIDQNL